MCNPCGNTIKISLRYHRLLIYDVKRTTKIDGMDPFNFSGRLMIPDDLVLLSNFSVPVVCKAIFFMIIFWLNSVKVYINQFPVT